MSAVDHVKAVLQENAQQLQASLVAELSGMGRGAICVLAIAGENAIDLVDSLFKSVNGSSLRTANTTRPIFGTWDGEEVIVLVQPGRQGSVDYLEVHCHGGQFAKQKIISDLQERSVQIAGAEALLDTGLESNRLSGQAVWQLPNCLTKKTAAVMNWQAQGALDRAFSQIEDFLNQKQFQSAGRLVDELLSQQTVGQHLTTAWRVVIAGAPNAGKSSLINAVLGFSRSIVFDRPGTTRDLVTTVTAIDGWPVELVDSAGIRETSDIIESQGVDLAQRAIEAADLVVEVVDGTQAAPSILSVPSQRKLTVVNKCDLPSQTDWPDAAIRISALTGENLSQLLAEIGSRLVPVPPAFGSAVPFLPSHIEWLNDKRIQVSNET